MREEAMNITKFYVKEVNNASTVEIIDGKKFKSYVQYMLFMECVNSDGEVKVVTQPISGVEKRLLMYDTKDIELLPVAK